MLLFRGLSALALEDTQRLRFHLGSRRLKRDSMRLPQSLPALALVLLTLLACKDDEATTERTSAGDPAGASTTTGPGTAMNDTNAVPEASPKAVAQDELEALAKEIVPRGIPTERSKPPTVSEWNAAPEFTVRFSGPLGCETKRVREWMRVSCRSNVGSGPQIQTVTVLEPRKKPPDYFTYEAKGVASVVLPLRTGMNAKVAFRWSERGKRTLSATWPQGAPAPGIQFDAGAADGQGSGASAAGNKPKCSVVCGGDRGFPSACEVTPCPKNFKCLDNHICLCTVPCED